MSFAAFIFIVQCVLICEFSHAEPMIGNVHEAKENEYPFTVSVGMNGGPKNILKENRHICTGVLISKRHVLTSAHCLVDCVKEDKKTGECLEEKDLKPEDIHVNIGSVDLRKGTTFAVRTWLTYAQYETENGRTVDYRDHDIVVLALKNDVENVKPVVLSTEKTFKLRKLEATAAGWGVTSSGARSRFLLTARVRNISIQECIERTHKLRGSRKILPPRFLCTFATPYALIQDGDSGGPLLNDKNELIGINGYTAPQENKTTDVLNLHDSIDFYRNFIMDAMKWI